MQRSTLSKVPNPIFPDIQDILLYSSCHKALDGPTMMNTGLCGSSLEGQRSIGDFFHILDYFIYMSGDGDDYKLQLLDNEYRPLLAFPPIERSSVGRIVAGHYLIESTVGKEIAFTRIFTLFDYPFKRTNSLLNPVATASRSSRDPPGDSQSFKMRLVYRDKGCVACLACGTQRIFQYNRDSDRFEGAHIIGFAHYELWDARGYSALISDPFTDPANATVSFASPTTRTNKDCRRINSLENGMLLCLQHHVDFASFRFAIHPMTHKVFSFHPATAVLQGVEVRAPWVRQDVLYPPPHPTFLEMHYFTSISRAMKGSGDDCELDDDDDEEF